MIFCVLGTTSTCVQNFRPLASWHQGTDTQTDTRNAHRQTSGARLLARPNPILFKIEGRAKKALDDLLSGHDRVTLGRKSFLTPF